eukprot:TRINITY_DN1663_c0_g1_i11.p1 TRINITY_DN1663_c0_g1~~TRINITY_DN1663_c0_g1_i11.p1  ORF type:complete len:292 (-),score=42.79 TRINITY_DN1663_c0_g1_i11:547-1422(-)
MVRSASDARQGTRCRQILLVVAVAVMASRATSFAMNTFVYGTRLNSRLSLAERRNLWQNLRWGRLGLSALPFPDGFSRDAPKGDAFNALPKLDFHGEVHLVGKDNEAALNWTTLESASVLGLDTETKPKFVKGGEPNPTALLQLAVEDECWIFQLLAPLSDETKARLQALLKSPVVKAGVGVQDDFRDLCRFHFTTMTSAEGKLDLQDIVKPYGLKRTGLRALSAIFLGRRMLKSQQTSNWASEQLSRKQISYAAVDAWAGWKLHSIMRGLFEGSEKWAPPRTITYHQHGQ